MKHSSPGTIDDFFQALHRTLQETLRQSGFGSFSIHSQRSVSYSRQDVMLCDSTQYSFAFTDQEIQTWQTSGSKLQPASINGSSQNTAKILQCLEQRLLRTWTETGRGCLEVRCDRSGRNTLRIIIGGAPSYCFHLSDQEVDQWVNWRGAINNAYCSR